MALVLPLLLTVVGMVQSDSIEGRWRGALDLAAGVLPFELQIERQGGGALSVELCNGPVCDTRGSVLSRGDSLVFDLADYAATITVLRRRDSLTGMYRNVAIGGPARSPSGPDGEAGPVPGRQRRCWGAGMRGF